jgi:hypothetical protein
MISIVRLARSFILEPDVTGACDVSVMSPAPCARLPQHKQKNMLKRESKIKKQSSNLHVVITYKIQT